MHPKMLATAMALAGSIIDPDQPKENLALMMASCASMLQIPAVALAIASHEEDREHSIETQGAAMFEEAFSPADILRQMADTYESMVSEDQWEEWLEEFRIFEAKFKEEALLSDLPET